MLKKIKSLWARRNILTQPPEAYTREQLENAYQLGYTDGRKDGLAIAREQATRSLREILKSQNESL